MRTITPAATGPHKEPDEYDLLARDLDVVSIAKDGFDGFINVDPINISISVLTLVEVLGAWHRMQRSPT